MSKPPSLDELQGLARAEDWDAIDPQLRGVSDMEEYLAWAQNGLADEDPNVRDLAVSLFEQTSHALNPEVLDALFDRMRNDENPYVQYRSAFALFSHGVRATPVIDTVRRALGDEDVAEIARGYLERL